MLYQKLIDSLLRIDIDKQSSATILEQFSTLLNDLEINFTTSAAGTEIKADVPDNKNQLSIELTARAILHLDSSEFSPEEQCQISRTIRSLYALTQQNDRQKLTYETSLDDDKSINPYTLELMGEKAKIGTWTLDLTNQNLYWSTTVKHIHEVADDYVPNVTEGINFYKEGWSRDKITECVTRALETGEAWDEELIIIDANGHEKWVRALGRAFAINDTQVLSGIFQDITLQKELIQNLEQLNKLEEEKSRRLKMAVSSAQIGFWDLNIETNTLSWDPEMFDIYGSDPDEFHGKFEDWSKHVHPDDLDIAVNAIEETLKGNEVFDTEFRVNHFKSDKEKIIKANAQVIRDDAGEPLRLVGVNYDVTEQRLYTRKQEEIAQMAYDASQAKSQFLATISHEIRTPLNGVIGMLGLVAKEQLQPEVAKKIKVADKSAHTLLTLINDVLDYSKIEDGKMSLEYLEFSLDECVDTMTDIFRYQIEETNLDFIVDKDFDELLYIKTDPVRLRQIVNNLVSNAIKFTKKGYISLRFSIDDLDNLNIVIQDTGIGIPKNMHARLFERFTQVDASTTRKFGGTGLGLAITQSLVEMQDGSIKLESEVGQGTTFTVNIPIEKVINPMTEQDSKTSDNLVLDEEPAELGHILIVEDNKVNQMVIRGQLKSHCDRITLVENGQEALDILNNNPDTFDMILMDCEMPVMDGYDTTKNIRAGLGGQNYHAIPIVALTANAFQEDKDRCFTCGMDGFVAKPVNVDNLLAELYRQI